MPDELDLAQAFEETHRAGALERARRSRMVGKGSGICVDCGHDIPEARRRAVPGAERCVDCQRVAEREGVV